MSAAASATPTTFYKMDIQGIVYLVDPTTSVAYTYDLTDPTPIGTLQWTSASTAPQIKLYEDWPARMAAKKMTWPGYPPATTPHDVTLKPTGKTAAHS
jgi:hypothetical protein